MNILVIGGCHTYGHGLPDNLDFIAWFIRQFDGHDGPVSVDRYCPIDLPRLTSLLPRLNLDAYDLILLQLGNYRLLHPPAFGSLLCPTRRSETSLDSPITPFPLTADALTRLRQKPVARPIIGEPSVANYLKTAGKRGLLRGLHGIRCLTRLNEVADELQTLLIRLQPHSQRTVLLTPFAHLDPVTQWLRQWGRQLFLTQGRRYGFRVVDVDQIIPPVPMYFLPGDQGHLNATGHQRLGLQVYAFCKSQRTTEQANHPTPHWHPAWQRRDVA